MKIKFNFIFVIIFCCLLVISQQSHAQLEKIGKTEYPQCNPKAPKPRGIIDGYGKDLIYRDLDNVLLYVEAYSESSESLPVPKPLLRENIIKTAIDVMQQSGLMLCVKGNDDPLKKPIIVNKINDARTKNQNNLTVNISITYWNKNDYPEKSPFFIVKLIKIRPKPEFLIPMYTTQISSMPIFPEDQNDKKIQGLLEKALKRAGIVN